MGGFAPYANFPQSVGVVIGSRLATLHELETVYGLEDMYDLLEVVEIDAYNERLAAKETG